MGLLNSMNNFWGKIQKEVFKPKRKDKIRGGGKSLGGSKPGVVRPISITALGPIGIHLENTNDGKAIVAQSVAGSLAEKAGLQRGDVICYRGSDGDREMEYKHFIDLVKSGVRPLDFDVRRISRENSDSFSSGLTGSQAKSADSYSRKQAVIAAAEARDKKNKMKNKPISKLRELTIEEK